MDLAIQMLHLADDLCMLAAQDELLCKLDSLPVRPEALQVVACGACYALEDLNRVARNAAPNTVMKRAAEARLASAICVELYVEVVLQTRLVVEFEAWADDALLH